jgi:hypothetical protein
MFEGAFVKVLGTKEISTEEIHIKNMDGNQIEAMLATHKILPHGSPSIHAQ